MNLGIVLILYPQWNHRADLSLTVRRTDKPHSTVRACGAEKLTAEKKSPQKRLQSVSESLRLFSSNRVCDCCGILHNSDYDLCGTENRCAGRLQLTEQDYSRYPQTVEVPFHS